MRVEARDDPGGDDFVQVGDGEPRRLGSPCGHGVEDDAVTVEAVAGTEARKPVGVLERSGLEKEAATDASPAIRSAKESLT